MRRLGLIFHIEHVAPTELGFRFFCGGYKHLAPLGLRSSPDQTLSATHDGG